MTRNPRCLVIAPRFPLPLQSGTQIREYHAIEALNKRFDVTVAALVQDENEKTSVPKLRTEGIETHTVSHTRTKKEALLRFLFTGREYRVSKFITDEFTDIVDELITDGDFDLIWVNFLSTLPVLPDDVGCPVILDEHNAAVRYWQSFSTGTLVERLFSWLNVRRVHMLQRRYASRIDGVVSVSTEDAKMTRDWLEESPVWVAPNGIDLQEFSPTGSEQRDGNRIVFVGSLDVRMNVDAIEWFVESIWPEVVAENPNVQFDIVGKNPSQKVKRLGEKDQITVVGEVPSVVPYYERAAIAVTPFRFGGGTKLKTLEALAMECGLVTTPVGAVGIDLEDGKHALVRTDEEEFMAATNQLLQDDNLRRDLAKSGREFVKENYTWGKIWEGALESICADLVRG